VKPFTVTIRISDLPEDEKRRRLREALDLLLQADEERTDTHQADEKNGPPRNQR
jgi:hypothetical protein